jgi:alanine racemase
MGLRLTVREAEWRHHVAETAAAFPDLLPVVKGNGYGFGRAKLAEVAASLSDDCAVGTVHEVADLPMSVRPHVLAPTVSPLPDGLRADAVLSVGSLVHVDALARHGWTGALSVKLRSSMHRYGVPPGELHELEVAARRAGMIPLDASLHLPLAGTAIDHAGEVEAWLRVLAPGTTLTVSHLDATSYARLLDTHPQHRLRIRLGTALWHGDKSMLHLNADVVDVHPVERGTPLGYRQRPALVDGHVVLVAAGTAHGVSALPDGRSPFHFARRRLELVEAPHMHTSMLIVPETEPLPDVGDRVDVQRPLTQTWVDEVEWHR